MSDSDVSGIKMSSDESINSDGNSGSNSDYGVVQLEAMEPYQDEPLAINRRRPRAEDGDEADEARAEEDDPDGIPFATLESRFEKRSPVGQWCQCNHCKDDLVQGAREHRCCTEVQPAYGKLVFDGSTDRISCITQHEDYLAVTNTAVLTQTGPLLKGKDGRAYKRRAGQSKNEYLRAVAYRWVIRYIFGYLGWDNARPLPACIYDHIRSKFPDARFAGFASSAARE